jgi:hypothetical protein
MSTSQSFPRNQAGDLVRGFWPTLSQNNDATEQRCDAKFLQHIKNEFEPLLRRRECYAVADLKDIFKIVEVLRQLCTRPLSEVLQALSTQFPNIELAKLRRSVELSVRLWLTLNISSYAIALGPTFANEVPLDWEDVVSLEDVARKRFVKNQRSSRIKVDPKFTAANLAKTCGIAINWTDYIDGHLGFDSERQVLTVYRHKVCLVNFLDGEDGCPIPRDLLNEALHTLNLLFPFGDLATKQLLFKENQQSFYGLGNCNRSRQLDLATYSYFREELEHLLDAFSRPPRTWKQLAIDRRNKMEWAAFWITILVGLLTVVSIPCNIIQATYSVKAYRVALGQGWVGLQD